MGYENYVPEDIRTLYEVHDYRHAAAILYNEFREEFDDIMDALRNFKITYWNVIDKGGSESQIPKNLSQLLRPDPQNPRWAEGQLEAELTVNGEKVSVRSHKVDYLKGRVALDMEWNSKDQTYDRDLNAFSTFYIYNRISVGVLITRSNALDPLFKELGIKGKYGASTTQMKKLISRLDAGVNGGCPVLVFGITPSVIEGDKPTMQEIKEAKEKLKKKIQTEVEEQLEEDDDPNDFVAPVPPPDKSTQEENI